MKQLILTVGIPASGKTTAIKKFFKNATIVSPDNFIGYTKDNPWSPKSAKEAWNKSDKLLQKSLESDIEQIVFDATFLKPKVRKKYIQLGKKYGYEIIALFCNINYKIAMDRNFTREKFRRVPKFIMDNMYNNIIIPTHDEGFKKILTFDSVENKLIESEKGESNGRKINKI